MEVIPVPVLEDNYSYLLVDGGSKTCGVVDPVTPSKVIEAAKERGVKITHVLTTHSHWDHAGGNEEIAKIFKEAGEELTVVGGKNDGIPACTLPVGQGDTIQIGGIEVAVLDVPCHTPGHVAFLASCGAETPVVFTGDTLFVGGCGNFNSGTPEQMHHALINVLGKLDDNTRVFVGHNYTEKNLRWALHVEPENPAVKAKLEETRKSNEEKVFISSTIGQEKQFNPFMRCVIPEIQQHFQTPGDEVATLLRVRRGKDEWGRSL
ncbi:Hydroxyacylglutathione hydrolase, mitochondrial [Hondaea fermentalgiana]|uniref:hydroxyacylglutathione hydrolase n=1 Tax=Hondaea fermentalgiana TaxID=2315210 RepID=A0A2R5GP03_9STRA|nr:Hydroxyacylglutathione hydrolase, mitochondrial [Hondaea fermentalgiana]|eukprot:GBG32616.1 Hydroxyacylglutathione hydrolase, mitochondrial [Hondaea fermentalgiana]